jgi:hypothetical protein
MVPGASKLPGRVRLLPGQVPVLSRVGFSPPLLSHHSYSAIPSLLLPLLSHHLLSPLLLPSPLLSSLLLSPIALTLSRQLLLSHLLSHHSNSPRSLLTLLPSYHFLLSIVPCPFQFRYVSAPAVGYRRTVIRHMLGGLSRRLQHAKGRHSRSLW